MADGVSDAVVIGAGVLGASTAFRLAEAGFTVTILEATRVGGGTSGMSFAWINSNGKPPRAFHADGSVREWLTTVGEIKEWVHGTLVPAMARAEIDDELDPGPWCRFCPAKLVCPMLTSLFEAACKANPKHTVNLNNESLGRSYQYVKAVKFYLKALEEEAFRRVNMGQAVSGTKLVRKKANRVFTTEGAALVPETFGDEAYTEPELKSPAAIEKLSPEGAKFVKEYAYTPDTGLTLALETDPGIAVPVKTTAETFGDAIRALDTSAASS